jgi:hypothetical protein
MVWNALSGGREMRVSPLVKLSAAATAGVVLPQVLVVFCLLVSSTEAWKLWHEFTWLGALGSLWVLAYCGAALMTILNIGNRRELRLCEWVVEAANILLVVMLATKCPGQHALPFEQSLPSWFRVPLCVAAFTVAQFSVTVVAWNARRISQRLQRELSKPRVESRQEPAVETMSGASVATELPPSKKVESATFPNNETKDPVLVA